MKIPAASIDQHVAITGKTGSGKTYAAKGIVEDLLEARRQCCIIDPTGAWWGLRLSADGKAKGFDLPVLGGSHADLPLPERSGAAVARLVTEQLISCIIDTSGFTVGEYTRWFTEFAGTLYTTVRQPMHLIIDEAHYFMPQGKVPDPQAGKMLHAGNRLMSGGRSRGIRGMLITQRPAKLHKDSLTCCDSLLAMRVIAPQDRTAIKEWIDGCGDPKQGKAVLDSLASLARGEGWFWYPEGGFLERMKFPAIKTYDSSATPKHGAKQQPRIGAIDLTALNEALAEAVREAEANEPRLLRQKIGELERTLKQARSERPGIDHAALDEAVELAVARAREDLKASVRRILAQFRASVAGAVKSLDTLTKGMGAFETLLEAPPATVKQNVDLARRTADPVKRPPRPAERNGRALADGIQPAHQRILDALAWLEAFGLDEPDRGIVAAIAGASPRSSAYSNNVSRLSSLGMIEYPRPGQITLTDAGRSSTNAPRGAGTLEELHDAWRACKALQPAHVRILDALIEAHPEALSREELAERAGASPHSSAYSNNVSRLSAMGLAEYPSPGAVRAGRLLFPDGVMA